MSRDAVPGVHRSGGAVAAVEPCTISVTNPATGRSFATVSGGGRRDAQLAVDAAASAWDGWRSLPAAQRSQALVRIADRLDEAATGDLPSLITGETGKRLEESVAEVSFSAAYFRWFAALIGAESDQTWQVRRDLDHQVLTEPVGPVAVLTPWNFPVSIPARKIAPALAAGCPVLFKPSEIAPLSGLRLAALIEAELPDNVLTTVVGAAEAVATEWLSDPRVRAVSFTGSTRVGRLIAAQAAQRFLPTVLELGGKAPFIVLPECDVAEAVRCLMVAKYRNNGQSCIAADTVWIAERHYDRFVEEFSAASAELVVGDPMSAQTTLGPTAMPGDPGRLAALMEQAAQRGATVVRPLTQIPDEGYYCAPMICLEPPPDSALAREELFGPALSIRPFDRLEDVLTATNSGSLGLAGYVMSSDRNRALECARRLDVGIVGVNTGTPNTPQVPFGGVKDSGIGYEGGAAGLAAFRRHRTIAVPPPSAFA